MNIHSFESMAAVDGEGLRYGIFTVGCPLRCVYCHNPDTWDIKNGREYSANYLCNKIKRYKPYFNERGGVTFSGGEPLLSSREINEIADMLKTQQIGYTIDTCGAVPLTEDVKRAILGAELIICDLKFPNEEDYFKYTKSVEGYSKVINFLDYCKKNSKRLWIRTVIIPNINDNQDYIRNYTDIVKNYIPEKYELLAFHTMGFFKYEELGIENSLKSTPDMDASKLKELQLYADKLLKTP